ncbi:Lycopene elongase/hydratase (dihydrobisanhydrobacterioruberin-forming) [Halorhabdus sp. SVX81]|uniref:prenyltransferase n=1 Tax=Halorhabdus sp. SVX81 TaxID=2978283 RepID=UPI0023DB349B|nr:prenyltransferase [Halorhabdus sp. SVX81]WEL18337.1 Lycopene elongase/hydratase (dihydrobisanhydrobacterioruberin-forming) [Halorhabdus sp. SVX81]
MMATASGRAGRSSLLDRLRYLLVLSRPRFWLYLAGPVVIGVVYAAGSRGDLITPLSVALFAYFLVPANVFLYGVNDVFDADIDTENPKKDEGPEVRFSGERWVLAVVIGSGLLAVPFALVVGPAGKVTLAAFLVLAVEYSAPPFRFKTTPGLDSLSNGLYVLPGVLAFTAVAGELPPTPAIVGGWLWTMAMHTFSAIPDIEPDRRAGIATTATVLGQRRTYAYCGIVWALAAGAFALIHPLLGATLAVYPLLQVGIAVSGVAVDRAYWWFPAINTVVGMALTMGYLWRLLYG